MQLNKIKAYSKPELIVMIGLPGSGKDHIIKQIIAENPEKDYYVASTDDIVEALAAERGQTYSQAFNDVIKQATKQLNDGVGLAIQKRRNIIWNQTNMAPGKRASILSRFPKEYTKKAIVVTVDEAVHNERLKARAEATGKNIPAHVMKSMRDSYVEPTREEGFDSIEIVDNTP